MRKRKRKIPAIKIEPKDKFNWGTIHVEFDEECVILMSDSFGEKDTSEMIVISNDVWDKLKGLEQ